MCRRFDSCPIRLMISRRQPSVATAVSARKRNNEQLAAQEGPARLLRSARLALGLTQKDVGFSIGCTGATVSTWERGECVPPVRRLMQLVSVLNLTTEQLLESLCQSTPKAP